MGRVFTDALRASNMGNWHEPSRAEPQTDSRAGFFPPQIKFFKGFLSYLRRGLSPLLPRGPFRSSQGRGAAQNAKPARATSVGGRGLPHIPTPWELSTLALCPQALSGILAIRATMTAEAVAPQWRVGLGC